jgi:sensor histidine kinase YesM
MYQVLILLYTILITRTVHFPLRALIPGLAFLLPALPAFYFFYGWIFPRFLQRRRLIGLSAAALLVSFLCAAVSIGVLALIPGTHFRSSLFSRDTAALLLVLSFIAFVNGVLALVIRGFINWYTEIRVKEELRRRNTEMELMLLRSQLNPHFLFNTLNNIDVLIEKDAALASSYLQQLSGLLRFMLYEVRAEKISIADELSTIEKYIQLQRIRTAYPDSIQYTVEGEPGDRVMIEPMLFLPIIENAFKHGEKKSDNSIRIQFRLDAVSIRFDCENRYQRRPVGVSEEIPGGLGDSLIRKRLKLLYPNRHVLEVEAGADTYKTTLILTHHAH